jgi:hypothetical protein
MLEVTNNFDVAEYESGISCAVTLLGDGAVDLLQKDPVTARGPVKDTVMKDLMA